MHEQDNAAIDALARQFATGVDEFWARSLVLERLPSGEHEWLRPLTDTCEGDDALYTLTDAGRRALALERLFGPWPTVAEAFTDPAA